VIYLFSTLLVLYRRHNLHVARLFAIIKVTSVFRTYTYCHNIAG